MEWSLLVGIQPEKKKTSRSISNRRNMVNGIGYVGDGGAEKATEDGEPVQRASYHHLFHQAWLACLAEAGIMKRYIVARFANWVRERMMKRHWGFFCPHAFQTLKAYHWLICWKMTNSGSYEIKLLGSASNLEQMQRRIG